MKKIKNKIMILIIVLIILNGFVFTTISNGANAISSADLYSKGNFYNLLRYQGIHLESDFVVYKHNGVEYPAYCLQKDLHGVAGSDNYSVSIDSLVTNVMVWRVITNGYPYKTYQELGCTTKEQAYLATKQAVYCVLYGRDASEYTAMNADGEKCLNALKTILNNAKKSTAVKISSNITIKAENTKWEIDKINNKYVSVTYNVTAEGSMSKYAVNLSGVVPEGTIIVDEKNNKKATFNSGEKFKILIPVTNLEKDGNFSVNIEGEVNTKPILYGKSSDSSRQDYALAASSYEDGTGSQKAYYTKNLTKIIILKQESESKKVLKGVEFEILDENQKVIHTGLVTDKNGEIKLENVLPGKYFIKETKTLEGYTLYDKLIEIDLKLNETSKVIVNNSEQLVKIETEKSETSKEVLSDKKEEIIKIETSEKEKEVKSESKEEVVKVKEETSVTVVKLPKTGM